MLRLAQLDIRESLSMIAAEFHETAVSRAGNPNSLLNRDVARLVATLQDFARKEGLPVDAVLSSAADLTRSTFCSGWLFDRASRKPRGYPGDYLLIQRIYDGSVPGLGLGNLLDRSFLASPLARAVQNRRKLLSDLLWQHTQPGDGRSRHILSLGCGPGQEIIDLGARWRVVDLNMISITCVDIDPRALSYLKRRWQKRSSHPILAIRADLRSFTLNSFPPVDFAYSAGVFDYLPDNEAIATIDNVWAVLKEGGLFVLGNFTDHRPPEERFGMDYVMQWHLVYRDADALSELIARSRFKTAKSIMAEPLKLNLFAILEK